jgi:vacuolar-type H+-ATPase subunit I/STV1
MTDKYNAQMSENKKLNKKIDRITDQNNEEINRLNHKHEQKLLKIREQLNEIQNLLKC